jgi:hypothetical protein
VLHGGEHSMKKVILPVDGGSSSSLGQAVAETARRVSTA